ncbi:MAG: type IV fimbrial biogenesis protein FimT [Planctomycetota bacterium]|jgi:type IV fimbrial biogenesis protein FimT
MKKNSGYTLIELMVTVALIGIVMAVGIPSMSDFIKNDRLSTHINILVGHLALARSTSVTGHQQVVICASSNQTSCNSTNWANGWLVFVDRDTNSDVSAGDDLLRVKDALTGDNTLVSSAGSVIVYDARGFTPASSGVFSLCDDRGATNVANVKSISISNTGRVRKGGSVSCT